MKNTDWNLVDWIIIAMVGVLTILLLNACGNMRVIEQVDREATTTFRHDLRVRVNGVGYAGVGVAPIAPIYQVTVFPEGKIDRIIWQTCHQESVVDKPDRSFWDVVKRDTSYQFQLKPQAGLEDVNACALEITVLEEKKRRNGFAVIDFEDRRPEISLASRVKCNGVEATFKGVSICQSSAGLMQEISFSEPALIRGVTGACDVMKSDDELKYQFPMPRGKCTYNFVAQRKHANGRRLVHRLNVVGYNDVPPVQ